MPGLFICLFLFNSALSLDVKAAKDVGSEHSDISLYDRLGGLVPMTVVVSDFVDTVITDESRYCICKITLGFTSCDNTANEAYFHITLLRNNVT